LGVYLAAFLIINGLFNTVSPLQAQTGTASSGQQAEGQTATQSAPQASAQAATQTATQSATVPAPLPDESTIVLGEAPQTPAANNGTSVFVVLRMVLVLALAALAIYGVVFFVKRLSRPQEIKDPHLKVLAKAPLSNDTFAAVVSVGTRAWLVGGSSGGVNLISEIDDPESLETMLLDDARKAAESGQRRFMDFRSLLTRLKGTPFVKRDAEPEGRTGSSHTENASLAESGFLSEKGSLAESGFLSEKLRKQRERLKGL